MINSIGCSFICGGTAYFSPWNIDEDKRGVCWTSSLFEDTAEYGFGIYKAY